jgi:hypothetical protein
MTHEPITTTLAEIRSHGPCEDGFSKIRDHFGVSPSDAKTHSEQFPVSLLLETNGLDDCLWVTAHVAPEAVTRFLIKRLDTGEHSALKTLRQLDGDFSEQISAVENVAGLLWRKLADENVDSELREAASAAARAATRAAYAAYAAAAARAAYAAYAAATADDARAAYAATRAAYAAARAATDDARAYAAAESDLKEILG